MTPRTTYNVRIWAIKPYKGARGTTYRLRWTVDGQVQRRTFATSTLADSFRSELRAAMNKGEPFNVETGMPVSYREKGTELTWYAFAIRYVDARWATTSANNRKNIAKVLTPVTIALLSRAPRDFEPVKVRTALREYAFNRNRRAAAPPDVVRILRWVERNSLPLVAWNEPDRAEAALSAVATKLDGKPAAASSVKRARRVLNPAMEYAVRHRLLPANPLPKGKGTTPKTTTSVDKRCLLDPAQQSRLLAHIRERPRSGRRMHAFFAVQLYAGARPEETVGMRVRDVRLPAADADDQWGELLLHTATPEVGKHWTDSGETHDSRDLKGRAEGETRPVPCHPVLTGVLREYIAHYELKPGDLLFPGEKGDRLAGSVFRRWWDNARRAVLTPEEYASPVGKRVYDCRHTCLTRWLNSGVSPARVARWAGNSVPVLLATYWQCINGDDEEAKKLLDAAISS